MLFQFSIVLYACTWYRVSRLVGTAVHEKKIPPHFPPQNFGALEPSDTEGYEILMLGHLTGGGGKQGTIPSPRDAMLGPLLLIPAQKSARFARHYFVLLGSAKRRS